MANLKEQEISHGLLAVNSVKTVEAPQWLDPKPELSASTRAASQYLFSQLLPHSRNCPFSELIVDGFDAEQIWMQIDIQTKPILNYIKRELKSIEKNPETIQSNDEEFAPKDGDAGLESDEDSEGGIDEEEEEGEEEEGEEGEEGEEEEEGFDEDQENYREEEEPGEDEEKFGKTSRAELEGGVEDGFLRIDDLEMFLEEEERREAGGVEEKHEEDSEEDDLDEDEIDDDDEIDGDDEVDDHKKNPRYEDFFGPKKSKGSAKRAGSFDGNRNIQTERLQRDANGHINDQERATMSTHEKQLEKIHSRIEQLERANLEAKSWTMQGEVTAARRPKNSALEVDLDFEHNMQPAPVITEEVTASLEDIIRKRIIEGQFDDVQHKPSLPSKAPIEHKQLDENKSQKGLAEIYEEDYMQKAGLASAAPSFRDELQREASLLFKKLSIRLDALSHFHFTPKPVIEEMSIQTNVPALAMEEVAPIAVSDAAMLAPEEVFAGKGDIKEEGELTKADRKRRRAKKKRIFKAAMAKRLRRSTQENQSRDRKKD
ncbi:U3 small nucleolar ribonucleoprotein protein MPP10 isoform X2 [Amborella trichopoda]|uniref:U3 small nucleolar ribonucleoprotein protein MPP10 isoform X2 n=1 Tax=Amborella trichopoda TaxID=13333 RepID=UPI0009C18FFE|nr:U3 small nucleolar ribonucleoprotein protein MPP10 isoform X2 [Amborella trichopoda]|eukprot:XP_020520694.1 U3 small nucleolar ribonucleoprotein protein MPP10 isoform X2 [Amborella trichopoda]